MADQTVVSFNKPTPMWATWVFRTVFCLTTAGAFWVAATQVVPEGWKVEVMLGMKTLDFVIWGIGRGLGIKKSDFEETQS
jgi:hypothetical protein